MMGRRNFTGTAALLLLLLGSVVALGARTTQAAGIGAECGVECDSIDNTICDTEDGTATGTCSCQAGYIPSQDISKCLKVADSWMSACEEAEQCSLVFGGEPDCINGSCSCRNGSYFAEDSCRNVKILGESCENSSECWLPEHPDRVSCSTEQSKCVCKEDYVLIQDNTTCGVRALGDACGADCAAITNSYCENNATCVCEAGYMPSVDLLRCLKMATAWPGICEETQQCSAVFGGEVECVSGVCGCKSGNHFLGGKCWPTKLLGADCNNDNECVLPDHPERVTCAEGKCVCKASFTISEDLKTCNAAGQLMFSFIALLPALLLASSSRIFHFY